jgi:hypothetical protein
MDAMSLPNSPSGFPSGLPCAAPLPPLPPGAPTTNGFKYRPRFGLVLEVPDEAAQVALFECLKGQGLAARVVTV